MNRRISLFLGTIILLTALGVALVCWLWGRSLLHRWLEEETHRVQGYIQQSVANRDRLLELVDNDLAREMREKLPLAAAALGSDPLRTTTAENLRQVADRYGLDDLYLIDASGTVVASTLPEDAGLDLADRNPALGTYLGTLQGTGTLSTHTISVSMLRGVFRKYGYFSPVGTDYVVEASYDVENYLATHFSPATRDLLLFRDFSLFPEDCHFVADVELYELVQGVNWSLTRRGGHLLLTGDQRSQLEHDGILDLKEGDGTRYILLGGHSPVDPGSGQFRERRVARIQFDRSRLRQELHTLLVGVVLSALLVGMVALLVVTEYVDRRYLSQLAMLNDAIVHIAEGDYSLSTPPVGHDELATTASHVRLAAERISQRERAFQRLTNNLNITLESMGETVIATDAEGRISRLNPAAETLTGWTALAASGREIGDVFRLAGADSQLFPRLLDRSRQEAAPVPLPACATVVSQDGTRREVTGSVAVIRATEDEALGYVLVCSDTTEQTRQANRLHEFESRLRAIMNHAPIAIALVTDEGKPAFVNLYLCKLLGSSMEDVHRRGIEAFTHPDDLARVRHETRRLLAGEAETCWFRARYLHPDGQSACADITMVAIREQTESPCLLFLGRDVTDEERITRELRWEREQRRLILDHTREYLLHLKPDLHVEWANRAADPEGHSISRRLRCHQLIFGNEEPCQGCPIQTAIRTGEPSESTVDAGGKRLMVTASPLYDGDHRLEGIVVSARDMTRLREIERQLFQAQKLDALGRLAGGIAHDFNNMLNVVIGYGELIGLEEDEACRGEYLAGIIQAARSAEGLVRQLLAFSRTTGDSQREELDLNPLVQAFAKMLGGVLPANVELELHLHPVALPTQVDRGQFEQALMNLCINARDAMADGGKLTIRTYPVYRDGASSQAYGNSRGGHFAGCEVSDTGTGIPERLLTRIFDPFFTTKPPGQGTGLGLSTTYAIITDHDGMIEVESTPGKGTTFRILFPLLGRVEAPLAPHSVLEPEFAAQGKETILVVEDDEPLRHLVHGFLERAGYQTILASTGPEAISLFNRHHAAISLALIDAILPGCPGIQVARHIGSRHAALPILFCSGYAGDSPDFPDIEDRLITKPFRRLELLRRIRAALDNRPDSV